MESCVLFREKSPRFQTSNESRDLASHDTTAMKSSVTAEDMVAKLSKEIEMVEHTKSPEHLVRDLDTSTEALEKGFSGSNKTGGLADPVFVDEKVIEEILHIHHESEWSKLSSQEKTKLVASTIIKILGALGLLFTFICTLDLLSGGFRLLTGRTTGDIFSQSELLQNPVVGVIIGILATVFVQSSSTSTSIIVSLVTTGVIKVRDAIPIIMGANMGTSVTNTIVSLTHAGNVQEFGRAFAGATVHDMFNLLTICFLLPIEIITGYLERITGAITKNIHGGIGEDENPEFLKVITDPVTKLIVQIDKGLLNDWSTGREPLDNETLLKVYNQEGPCLLCKDSLADIPAGIILVVSSLVLMITCLIFLVKILHALLKGSIATVIQKTVNAQFVGSGYVAIAVGAIMTFLVQSSSVFTSALTPLVGIGVIEVDRVYPLTLGSNVGTTSTAILAALTAEGDDLRRSLQAALCHLFFNISGILLFYVVPAMRWPLPLCKTLGNTVAAYRWFAFVYVLGVFFVIPALLIGLSLITPWLLIILVIPFGALIVTVFQRNFAQYLPLRLRTWDFLPRPLRSLSFYDEAVFSRFSCCQKYVNGPETIVNPYTQNPP
ncbi:unnamed protein product [Cyprideis torosa]|uniref:Uncharacterized protein n=1 Tax=Cyprideis torosa TaxID=163714 RepID=A0A7R8ZPI7_9CRUS|nr:unnamed protein product [Cyprideis torosa]CAG0898971.1 unnamed protein product [Cyprideis torosa]